MNLIKYLFENCENRNKPLILTQNGEFSYSQVINEACTFSDFLIKSGARKGERVVLIDESSFFWVTSYLGSILAGCVSVPLPVNISPDRISSIISQVEPTAVFIGTKCLKNFREHLKGVPIIISDKGKESGTFEDNPLLITTRKNLRLSDFTLDIDEEKDLAAIMFTSGSTGEPRGVMVSHRNIITNTRSIINSLSLTNKDRIMAVLPFYYCFGTSLLHTHLAVGGSIVIENSFLFPEHILNRMEETGCTGLAGVPSTFQILLRKSTIRNRKFEKLRYVQQAGGKLPITFIDELKNALPGKQIYVMYGQTEATARLSCLPSDKLEDKIGSIGKGIPEVQLQVLNNNGKEVIPGEIGEIVASGNNITAGYWDAPEESAKYFRNGKLYTGDLAKVDDEGYIYIVDREKDFIKCAGHRVSSKEIEEVVLQSDGVVEVLAIGVEDDRLGEAICIFVSHVRGEEATEELEKHCKMNIKWPFTPRQIIILENLPKNSSGKPDKLKLKAMV